MHLAPLIRDLAVILGVAGIVTLIFQRIRQPLVLGYIVAGMIVGPYLLSRPLVSDLPSIQTWAELGIIFLMFSLGLEFSFRKLAMVGLSAGITALIEVASMMLCGFGIGKLLGWGNIESVFLGSMLSISSTTIIVRALDELKLKTRRFAQNTLGILIVEDLIAILILVALSTLAASESFSTLALLGAAGQLLLVVVSWFVTGYFVVPRFVRYVGRAGSNEMLLIIALGLCLSLVAFAAHLHYSAALGAFIMGSILAESTESFRIEEQVEPLRDLFSAIFFVSVGMLIDPHAIFENWKIILLFSGVVIFGKIFFSTAGALLTGQSLRGAIQVGFGLAQIGEFSFIIAGMGITLKVARRELYPIAVSVSLLTTFTTPYLIRISHRFAVRLENRLPLRTRVFLTEYVRWTQERRADASKRKQFYRQLLAWGINGILVTVLFILSAEFLKPKLTPAIAGGLATLMSTPFLWAMFHLFKPEGPQDSTQPRGATQLIFRTFAVLWLSLLSIPFFELKTAAILFAGLMALLFIGFYRQLSITYRWFEKRFVSTFESKEKTRVARDALKKLAPWDAHLVRLKVHPNSEFVLQSLKDASLRSRYGISVVAIQRGMKTLVAPKSSEVILPKDELLVLGTDEPIESLRGLLERPPGLENRFAFLSGYELRPFPIPRGSPLAGLSLRDAQIPERFDAMVVGLERRDLRTLNPAPDFLIEEHDILWLVGAPKKLDDWAQAISFSTVPSGEA